MPWKNNKTQIYSEAQKSLAAAVGGRKHNLQDCFSACFSKDADASDRQTEASLFIVIKEIIIITKGWDFKNIKKESGVCSKGA